MRKSCFIIMVLALPMKIHGFPAGQYLLHYQDEDTKENYLLLFQEITSIQQVIISTTGTQAMGYIKNLTRVDNEYLFGWLYLPNTNNQLRCKIWEKNQKAYIRIYGKYQYYTFLLNPVP